MASRRQKVIIIFVGLFRSFRFSFGRPTTQPEVEEAANIFIDAVKEYRSQSPAWGMHLKGIDVDSLDLR